MSWVLLTGEFAYKLKRPVRYPFVDFSNAKRREFSCREELRLNRRFAAELYLDVCNVTNTNGAARIGGAGETIEHAVKMLQFDRAAELDQLLAAQAIAPAELEAFGRELVTIYAGPPRIAPANPWRAYRRSSCKMSAIALQRRHASGPGLNWGACAPVSRRDFFLSRTAQRIARTITLRHDSRLITKHRIKPPVYGVYPSCAPNCGAIASICLFDLARICGASTAVSGQNLAIGPVLIS